MATKMTREEILTAAVQIYLDEAWEIQEQMTTLNRRRNSNRAALVNESNLGHLTSEQTSELEELYPTRERATPAERVARLEDQLAKAREKAGSATVDAQPGDDAA
jgi:hypothetical protein